MKVAPGPQHLPQEVLGAGPLAITDISQTQLWRDHGPQDVVIQVTQRRNDLPNDDRAALRLAAGTSSRAVGRTINKLLIGQTVVTGAEVFAATPAEFRRLGTLVSLLDLAVLRGRVDASVVETVRLSGDRTVALTVCLPHLRFDAPVPTKEAP